ncbi:MAG: carboxypeptidase-like regulatory domain-containing protein [Chitinophagaceae bacterium]|nr:MAG: carboxypeptidase-like regulatory domain-containing protein [Chitinophagaceae bacterium]
MQKILLVSLFCSFSFISFAGKVSGLITDDKGNPLAYASVSIKGTTKGTTSNSSGRYSINLSPGKYTLVCQYVGYGKSEKTITVTDGDGTVNFSLSIQELTLQEVVVKRGGEDPAYEIIRQAIKKRSYYNDQVDSFSVNVYIKGLMRSKGIPKKVLGKTIERDSNDGLDSSGKGILFLSESLTKVDYAKPNKIKLQVISSRESGGGFGLNFPFFINFYQNNVSVFDNNLNPRGFISPIADGALSYYKYKYEGSFIEDGVMVNTIKVTPRRKNEPLFSGTIQITEDDWRIYSTDLFTTRDYSLEMLDTLRVTQIHSSVARDIWKTKSQVVYLVFKQFGFHITGNFVNVYNDYNINPGFDKKYFGRVLMKYDTAFNKKDTVYWNRTRPVALENDEKQNFIFKDSISQIGRDSMLSRRHIDSLRKHQKPITLTGLLWSGQGHNFYGKKSTVNWYLKPLITQVEYNTVEGVSLNVEQSFNLWRPKSKYSYQLNWNTRYGFSNTHLNSYADLTIRPKSLSYRNRYLRLSGGKRLSQFNQDNPINPLTNAAYTLLGKKNYMKLYENWFGRIEYNNKLENGLNLNLHATYEDRLPVENTTDFSFFNKDAALLPNHPYELASMPFLRNQALVAGFTLSWQPGQRYIEYPWGKRPLPSKAPVFELEYNKGISKVFGSDADFDKWKFSMADNMNFKIGGEFKYKVGVGGFFNSDSVSIPDLQHFNGNQTFYNIKYLNSFQLAPYYRYSNAEKFYIYGHAEHHFNGLLTNKTPFLNKLKWYLVGGSNAFYVNKNNYYVEVFAGLENIFKLFRVDFVNAYQPGLGNRFGVRIGFGGLIGGKLEW